MNPMTDEQARTHLERLRWPTGAICPHCDKTDVGQVKGGRAGLYQCRACRKQFTVTVGTIFEGSHLPLSKWLYAVHLLCASKKGMSALQLSRMLDITYKSAWFMAHRIRYAMQSSTPFLGGIVEADETYVGGKRKGGQKEIGNLGRSRQQKTPVMVMVERDGRAVSQVISSASTKNLHSALRKTVAPRSTIMTDDFSGYRGVRRKFRGGHFTVKHKYREYARGNVHVNTAESFFALLKRGIHGTFHHVSAKHLNRYCGEFDFRWNHRHVTDAERTEAALALAPAGRLEYRNLIHGKAKRTPITEG